jgi:hypothetical protein
MANSMKIKVPVSALEEMDDSGKPMAPEMGDEVSLPNVMATIDSVDGDYAMVTIKSVAGEECGMDEESPDEDMGEPSEEMMMKKMKEMDGE